MTDRLAEIKARLENGYCDTNHRELLELAEDAETQLLAANAEIERMLSNTHRIFEAVDGIKEDTP